MPTEHEIWTQDYWHAIEKSVAQIQNQNITLFQDILTHSEAFYASYATSLHRTFQAKKAPLGIFSPEIVTETLQKAQDLFQKILQENPKTLEAIGLKHFEKQQNLYVQTLAKIMGERSEIVIHHDPNDRRFHHPAWENVPYFSFLKQHYLLFVDLLKDLMLAMEDLEGEAHTKLQFYLKQLIHAVCPSNFPMTNPEVIHETWASKGENLKKGLNYWLEDLQQGYTRMTDMDAFQVGHNIASTPGDVIFENDLLQLIHYRPITEKVFGVPLLIVPAWINKFYMFDLSPHNSFVRWCLEQGLDVYIISWVNPTPHHKHKTFCDYVLEGLYRAVREVQKQSCTKKLNVLANCAGGILLNCLMAYLESHHIESPFSSASTLASPIDMNFLGDLKAFICDTQLKMLEESLEEFGIVPGNILVQSFNLLRPNDLLWSYFVKHYLLGKSPKAFDILFWNCDSVNLPGRMHSQYLRNIFLENKLMKAGAMRVAGTPIDFQKIKTPSFILGAIKDHIAPWESSYALSKLVSSEIKEYVLVGSGHISGIINPPLKNKYGYWTNHRPFEKGQEWLSTATAHQGSWWGYWLSWVRPYLGEEQNPMGNVFSIEPAPGRFVLEKRALSKISKF